MTGTDTISRTVESDIPLRLGDAHQFALARQFFARACFAEKPVLAALGIEWASEIASLDWRGVALDAVRPDLRWCLEVFIRGEAMPAEQSRAVCGAQAFEALWELGLLCEATGNVDAVMSPVWLYPIDGFLIASDRHHEPDGSDRELADDIVFPAAHPGTIALLRLVPNLPGRDTLDLGGGTGVVAMHMARMGAHAVTSDLTARAAFFAAFNSRLNDIGIESVRGDLYEAVNGRQFDFISMHAPYVPSASGVKIFADGGASGEELIRRMVAGLPTHLRRGGVAALMSAGRDTEEAPFEWRVREWLGAAAGEFDVVMGFEAIMPLDDVAKALRRHASEDEVQAALERLQRLGAKHFAYGLVMLRRCGVTVQNAPTRLQVARDVRAADFERVFAWRESRRGADFAAWLAQSRPRSAPETELAVRYVVRDGRLAPAECTFSINRGFQVALRVDAFLLPLFKRLDGSRSVSEVFALAQQAGELPEKSQLAMLLGLISLMVERGLLIVDNPERASSAG